MGVKALLQNPEGKFLLVRRSADRYPEVGPKWDIVGGRIEPGTPLLENLKREIQEEVGLVLIAEPRLIAAQDILRIPGRHVVRLTYVAPISGDPRLDSDHTEFRWASREELAQLTEKELDIYVKALLNAGLL